VASKLYIFSEPITNAHSKIRTTHIFPYICKLCFIFVLICDTICDLVREY